MVSAGSGSYRTDIDGLRALAVLPVVLYHYGVTGVPGGFVGVDIFFVISGFLIGGILWSELTQTGRIRLGAFFGRRIRRLAPAYLAMALATFVGAWFILLPFDFREFGQDLIAATVYLANVHFYRSAGYFDTASDLKLLLHTWSLSVEEQFYLVLPPMMLIFARRLGLLPIFLAVLGGVSLIACLVMMRYSATAAFYLFPFRAWELMTGVLLAIWGRKTGFDWRVHAGLSWFGLGLIVLAVLTFSAGSHFPGAYAIVPVAGAVLIILNGRQDNLVNYMLASRGFLFFGLISYSLYLWHWPMVTLWRYFEGGEALAPLQIAALLGVSIAVSWLSYRFVETPFRRGALPDWRLPVAYVVSSACVVAGAFSFAFSSGFPGRFIPEIMPYIAASRDFTQDWRRCEVDATGPWSGLETCPIGPEGPPQVLVWGDSHARAFKEGLERTAFEVDTPGLLIWRGGCPPLFGVLKDELVSTPVEEQACARSAEIVAQGVAATPSITDILLIGRWSYYAQGTGVGADSHNRITLAPLSEGSGPADQAQLFNSALQATAGQLTQADRSVYVLRQVPEIFDYTARRAAQEIAYGRAEATEVETMMGRTQRGDLQARFEQADAALVRAAEQPGVESIDLWGTLCTPVYCSAVLDGQPIYFDNNHVTNTGALMLRAAFIPLFENG